MLDYLVGPGYVNPLLRVAGTVVKDLYEGRSYNDNSYTDWITNGQWDQSKYNEYLVYKAIPGISQYTSMIEAMYDDASYMKQNQLTWDDVRRPWKLRSTNAASGALHYGLNFVSSNVKRLYS